MAGPYTSVCSTPSLLQSSIRTSAGRPGGSKYARRDNDPRFSDSYGQFQSIATRSSVFAPRLRDERYLPFERCGVISIWSMTLARPLTAERRPPGPFFWAGHPKLRWKFLSAGRD